MGHKRIKNADYAKLKQETINHLRVANKLRKRTK